MRGGRAGGRRSDEDDSSLGSIMNLMNALRSSTLSQRLLEVILQVQTFRYICRLPNPRRTRRTRRLRAKPTSEPDEDDPPLLKKEEQSPESSDDEGGELLVKLEPGVASGSGSGRVEPELNEEGDEQDLKKDVLLRASGSVGKRAREDDGKELREEKKVKLEQE